mgnify:CR=1 FL=1|tara:strand:+ start:3640 stop:5754 length:2115 start_codon:yes stop_codon:yes gene_type:complete
MVNYTVNPTPREVNSGEIWGDQDLDFVPGPDNGEIPLGMTINANEGYTVTASNFNIKGCSPTYIFTDTNGVEVREWSNGEQTTYTAPDGTTSTVTIGEGDFVMPNINKVQMRDSSITTSTEVLWPTSGYTESDLNNGTFNSQAASMVSASIQLGSALPSSQFPNSNGGLSNVLLGGTLVQAGDVFGAFYEQDGNYICAGIEQFTSTTLNQTSNWMQIFGDMSQSPIVPSIVPDANPGFGFTYGQEIHFFILQQSTGNTYRIEFESWHPNYEYSSTTGFQNSGQYKPIADDLSTVGYDTDVTLEDSTTVSLYEQTQSTSGNNFIYVKAWVDYNYTIGIEDTQLYLDIDGDAQPIESENTNSVKITLNMANGEDSNCIVHVLAKTEFSYTSGNYNIPASSWNYDDWLSVISIPETGSSSSATVEIALTDIGVSNGSGYFETTEGGFSSLMNLFVFVIEPLPGHCLHQGWVAPGVYIDNNQTFEGDLVDLDGNAYDISTVLPWWETYEIYLNSPVSIIPDPIPSSPNGYWWPGFASQYSKWFYDTSGSFSTTYCAAGSLENLSQEVGFQDDNSSGRCEQYLLNYWKIKEDENTEWWIPLGVNEPDTQNYPGNWIGIFNTVGSNMGLPWNIANFGPLGGFNWLSDFEIQDFDEPKNNVIVNIHRSLSLELVENYLGKEMILNILGGAQLVPSSMPTVPINGIISEDTD